MRLMGVHVEGVMCFMGVNVSRALYRCFETISVFRTKSVSDVPQGMGRDMKLHV